VAAYAVIARIGRVDPHLTLHDLEIDLDGDASGSDRGLPADSPTIVLDRPDASTLGERLGDHLGGLGEALGQMTFYLFDPESWRR
jgi:hypothetical protein